MSGAFEGDFGVTCERCGERFAGGPHVCEDARRERHERMLLAAGQRQLEGEVREMVMSRGRFGADHTEASPQQIRTLLLALWMHFNR